MGKNRKQHSQKRSPRNAAARVSEPYHSDEDKGLDSVTTLASPVIPSSIARPSTAAALSLAMECGICTEKYDGDCHKPRNLKCGHTFCIYCCLKLVRHGAIICPKCRTNMKVEDPHNLPVNYPLLELLRSANRDATETANVKENNGFLFGKGQSSGRLKKEQSSPHGGKCLDAQAEVVMHCAHCDMWLCKDCSHIDHRRPDCILMPYQDTLKEMGQTGKATIRATQHALADLYSEVNVYGSKLSSCAAILEIALDCIKKEKSQLPGILIHCRKLEQDLSDIVAKSVPTYVKDALNYLDGLETATQVTQQWAADAHTSVLKVDQVDRLSKNLLQTVVQMVSPKSGSMMGLHSFNGVDMTLPMDMDGGRLLVHVAQRNTPTPTLDCKLVKLQDIKSCIDPSCALTFLDISLRGRMLGRVFIRLLGNTKWSRCFLLMCTGETGPSFKNTRFHRLWWVGQPGEHIWAGDYDHGDGSGGSLPRTMQDKIKELSNEKTEVPVHAGLVAARCGNNNTIFRVYIRESRDVVEEFAFGRVEYGLQVFDEALKQHNNMITDLTISSCGVVVEP